jgi:hypothetical protein
MPYDVKEEECMDTQKITEQIIKEITSIMEEQQHLGAEKENYRHNENAVKTYVDILKVFDDESLKSSELELKKLTEKRLSLEYELKANELKTDSDIRYQELKLKFMEEERLAKEIQLKEQEMKIEFENRLRADILDAAKVVGSGIAFTIVLAMILAYERDGVITTKSFGPFIGQAFRVLLPK